MKDPNVGDEVDLIGSLRILYTRRKLIFFTTLVFVLLVGLINLSSSQKYETVSQIQIGRIWGKEIENPYLVIEWIGSDAFLTQLIKRLSLDTTPKNIRSNIKTEIIESGSTSQAVPLLISIRVLAEEARQAVNINKILASILIERHKTHFDESFQEHYAYEKDLSFDVERIEIAIRELENLVKKQQLRPTVNAPSVILLQSQLEQKNVQLLAFKRELKDTRINNNSTMITVNTRLISPPILPKEPVGRRTLLSISVAGIVGLFFSAVFAFFLEYVKQAQAKERILAVSTISRKKKERVGN